MLQQVDVASACGKMPAASCTAQACFPGMATGIDNNGDVQHHSSRHPQEEYNCHLPRRSWLRARKSAMMRSRLVICCTYSCAAAEWACLPCFDAVCRKGGIVSPCMWTGPYRLASDNMSQLLGRAIICGQLPSMTHQNRRCAVCAPAQHFLRGLLLHADITHAAPATTPCCQGHAIQKR
jgi:hypothetical protein